jgi:hypothetical protein
MRPELNVQAAKIAFINTWHNTKPAGNFQQQQLLSTWSRYAP